MSNSSYVSSSWELCHISSQLNNLYSWWWLWVSKRKLGMKYFHPKQLRCWHIERWTSVFWEFYLYRLPLCLVMLDQTSGPVSGPTNLYLLVFLEARGPRKWPSGTRLPHRGGKGASTRAPIVFLQLSLQGSAWLMCHSCVFQQLPSKLSFTPFSESSPERWSPWGQDCVYLRHLLLLCA